MLVDPSVQQGGAWTAPPHRLVKWGSVTSEVELLALVHVGSHVTEARRLHDIQLQLEDAGSILVLVGPLEPDRDSNTLELLEILDRQTVDFCSGPLEFTPRFHIRLLNSGMVDARVHLDLVLHPLLHLGRKLVPVLHS